MGTLIGIFGGTFDPPHLAHAVLADEASYALGLSRVLWVLTAQPPHKPGRPISDVEHRIAMVEFVTRGDAHFELSRADLDREPPHYAVGTLDWIRARYPDERVAYLMGSDSLRDLPTWHTPQAFVEACDLIGVMRRRGAEVELNHLGEEIPDALDKLQFFDIPLLEISGSEIRRRVKAGEPHRYFLTPEIAHYIELHQLYQ